MVKNLALNRVVMNQICGVNANQKGRISGGEFQGHKKEWVSGLHISHTFMKNYGTNRPPAKNFSNANFIPVNCVGLTPIDLFVGLL